MESYSEYPTKANAVLWIMQGLLALTFLFAGGIKLVTPAEAIAEMIPLPVLLVKLIGIVEVSGALGVILPGLLRIRPALTPLAAAGLLIVMSGATGFSLGTADLATAAMPAAIGVLAMSVAYGRWRLAPHREAYRLPVLQPAV